MKTLLMILIILPHILLAGWIKEGNGYISQDSLPGQKRFLPAENALIVENKDFVLKYDLTTGEIIKRIDIEETDPKYVTAVANDDLSQVYILTEDDKNDSSTSYKHFLIVKLEDYLTKKVYLVDSIPIPTGYHDYVVLNSYIFYYNNKIFYSLDNNTKAPYHYITRSELRIYSASNRDTLQRIELYGGKIDSYSLLNPFSNYSFFTNYESDYWTEGEDYSEYLNQLLFYSDSDEKVYSFISKEGSGSFSNIVNGKTNKNRIYAYGGKLTLSGMNKNNSRVLNYGDKNPISFTKNDNYFFVVSRVYNQGFQNEISIQSFDGDVIFEDTMSISIPTEIVFDDGKTFYFSKNDKLFKYSPEFLKLENLKAVMKELKDTIYLGEVLTLYSLSMGSPDEIKWYLNDELVSEEQIYDISISSVGNHTVKLVVKNEELFDSIMKDIFVEELDINVTKELDFEIEYVSKDPLVVKFVVPDIYDFKSYSWNFGDGVVVPGNKVKYKYQDTGTYSVTLTAIREDGTFNQEIKADVVSSSEINLDYTKPLFEKFRLRDNKRFYFKPLKTLNNVHIRVFDKNEILLFDEEYTILSRGEVNSITTPVDEIYTIQVETSDGEVYEY